VAAVQLIKARQTAQQAVQAAVALKIIRRRVRAALHLLRVKVTRVGRVARIPDRMQSVAAVAVLVRQGRRVHLAVRQAMAGPDLHHQSLDQAQPVAVAVVARQMIGYQLTMV